MRRVQRRHVHEFFLGVSNLIECALIDIEEPERAGLEHEYTVEGFIQRRLEPAQNAFSPAAGHFVANPLGQQLDQRQLIGGKGRGAG